LLVDSRVVDVCLSCEDEGIQQLTEHPLFKGSICAACKVICSLSTAAAAAAAAAATTTTVLQPSVYYPGLPRLVGIRNHSGFY